MYLVLPITVAVLMESRILWEMVLCTPVRGYLNSVNWLREIHLKSEAGNFLGRGCAPESNREEKLVPSLPSSHSLSWMWCNVTSYLELVPPWLSTRMDSTLNHKLKQAHSQSSCSPESFIWIPFHYSLSALQTFPLIFPPLSFNFMASFFIGCYLVCFITAMRKETKTLTKWRK